MSSKEGYCCKSLLRLRVNDVADCILFLSKSETVHLFGSCSVQKLVGCVSIFGHDLDDKDWHLISSSGPCLVTLKCSSTGQRLSSFKILDEFKSNENKVAVKQFTNKMKDIRCILLLKSSWLTSRFQCKDLFDLSGVVDVGDPNRCQKDSHSEAFDGSELSFTVFSDAPPQLSPLIVSKNWPDTSSFTQLRSNGKDLSSPVILTCGGKGVGKSTFARHLINKFLNTQRPLYFMETDVGQSEFTPPGILSLNKVDKPVFGSPYSHLLRPEKACFFGDVTPKDRPSSYIRFIYMLYRYYKEHCNGIPLIVNTHGWYISGALRHVQEVNSKMVEFDVQCQTSDIVFVCTVGEERAVRVVMEVWHWTSGCTIFGFTFAKDLMTGVTTPDMELTAGMGVKILLDIIRIVEPTHIIQINSESEPMKNLPELNRAFIENETGWIFRINKERDTSESSWRCTSHIHQMNAFKYTSEGISRISLQPSELRSLSVLSYFGFLQSPSSVSTVQEYILNHCPVHCHAISSLKLYIISEDVPATQILHAMNGSIVGLAKLNTDMASSNENFVWHSQPADNIPYGDYIGLGIVRNIDPDRDLIYIITPEPSDNLREVNALVKGKLEVPESVLKKRKRESPPYLTSEFSYNHRGSGQKKVRYNLLRQRTRSPHVNDHI